LQDFASLHLFDRELGVAHQLTAGAYTFTNFRKPADNRFFLTKRPERYLPDSPLVQVYPNPVIERVKIETYQSVHSLELLNGIGQVVMNEAVEPGSVTKLELDLSHLPSGIYFVRLTGEKGSTLNRIVKH
jgi:Secretion system C-terminal sorting domain